MSFLGLCSCFWPFFCWLERLLFSKMSLNLMQYHGTVGVSNSWHFVFDLKRKDQPLLIHYHSNVFSYYVSFIQNSVVLVLFLAVFLILKLSNCKKKKKNKSKNSRASTFLVTVIKTRLVVWFCSPLLLYVNLICRNAFSNCHWNLNSISAHSYAKVLLRMACCNS